MSTTEQKFGVFEMPYLIVSRAHMKKVAENKQTQSALLERLPPEDEDSRCVGKRAYHQQPQADRET